MHNNDHLVNSLAEKTKVRNFSICQCVVEAPLK